MEVTDLVKLINACRKAGIREFRDGTVSLVFGDALNDANRPLQPVPEESKEETAKRLQRHEVAVRQDQLEVLRLADPAAYEELIEKGDLDEREET